MLSDLLAADQCFLLRSPHTGDAASQVRRGKYAFYSGPRLNNERIHVPAIMLHRNMFKKVAESYVSDAC